MNDDCVQSSSLFVLLTPTQSKYNSLAFNKLKWNLRATKELSTQLLAFNVFKYENLTRRTEAHIKSKLKSFSFLNWSVIFTCLQVGFDRMPTFYESVATFIKQGSSNCLAFAKQDSKICK